MEMRRERERERELLQKIVDLQMHGILCQEAHLWSPKSGSLIESCVLELSYFF